MHLFRTFVLLLLSFALPLYAGAGPLADMPCPMQAAAAHAQEADMPGMPGTGDAPAAPCCDEAQGSAAGCHAGADCQAGGVTLPSAGQPSPAAQRDTPLRARATLSRLACAPADIWRPPALQGR